ncbi:VOC family protein [Nocardiopsis sp. MG754419]|uniref:VOC family protein n=1 Tax=Nocardiopsis sp. MG754419 TaxID=2259865 RepID=UPI001BAB0DD5|nr:VOC family protein [Nocardiopsis sp. MG754419]MBR8740162.1 VOC family protein [Nocardiopsis sp. MG754419]
MFDTTRAFGSFAVPDTDAAREFYGTTLGLDVRPVPGMEEHGLLQIDLGEGRVVLVYPKPDHAPAVFTVLNLPVDDIDAAVDELVRRGVTMLRYDAFEHDEKGVVRGGEPLVAWFADPAGNTIGLIQE